MLKELFFLGLLGAASAFSVADWQLVAEKQECGGNEKYVGRKKTLDECAHSCRGTTSMFIYGTNDFGERKCSSSGCYCFCELSSTAGKCNQVSHNGYRLYKYESVNIDWKLVAERKECEGSETNIGWKRTVADCADACRDKSSLFIFGTNDFGTNRCLLPCRGCKCFCENTSSFGICEQEIDHDGYRLYRFENEGPAAPPPTTVAPETPEESNEGMCTGDFQENDSSNAGNGLQRPPAGTKCTSNCHYDLGRWGSSWCYTDNANVQWGAECVECGSQPKPMPGMCTGDFQESDSSNAGNELLRPPAGTKCTSNCFYDSGRWGSSWCYTDNDNVQWGAECVECGSETKPGEDPATEAPATEAPATEAPATDAPATEAPATEAPATEAPATEAPATEAPATEAPEGGLVCQSDDECKTEAEMGAGWGSFFADQPNAPCLDLTNFGMDGMMCFTSTGGSLKTCTCWDPNEEFDNEWCNTARFGDDHTMCIYEEGAQEACGEVSVAGITSQELKDSIVSKHNELRAKVANGQEEQGVDGAQPKAANMMELVWSDELAEVAQRWVDQCAGAHDDNRRTEKFSSVGQNWAARYGGNHDDSSELADLMVENWYNEVADITLQAVNSFSSDQAVTGSTGVIGHYTQVVWAETTEVGCGYMTSFVNNRLESVLVCNYGPAGNWQGNAVYEQGEPGSNCPTGTSATSAGLCA